MTQPDGLGGWLGDVVSYGKKVGAAVVAGAAAGGAIGAPTIIGAIPGAIVGGFVGGVVAAQDEGSKGGPGAGEQDTMAALPCGSGPGASPGACCPPDWQTRSVRVNPDGSTGVTCSNGDLVTVKGTQVFSRVTRAELEGLFNTVGTVYEVTKAQDTARKLAAARAAAQAKADAALRSPATQEAVAAQSSNRALVVVGLMLAAGVGTYLYTRRR